MLETDGLGGRLSFVFYSDLTPQQVSDAYAAMGETAKAVLNYCTYLYAQLASKRARPALYQSTMPRSEENTSELQSLMRISYAVFCLKNKQQPRTPYKRK